MLVVSGVLVRRSDMALLSRRRGHLTLKAQHFQEEQSDSIWTFAQLRCLSIGLVTVSHANLVGLIRIPRPSTHTRNATGEPFRPHVFWVSPGDTVRRDRGTLRHIGDTGRPRRSASLTGAEFTRERLRVTSPLTEVDSLWESATQGVPATQLVRCGVR